MTRLGSAPMLALPFFRRDTPRLAGTRVTLRLPEAGDFHEWSTLRQESRAFLEPWEPRWSPDEFERHAWRQRIQRYREDFARGHAIAFFIMENSSRRLVGGITVGNIRRGVAQSGQIGYWVGERFAGKGLMVDAVRLVVPYAFGSLHLHRIEAACIPGNARSIRVLEKAGFTREGLLRSYLKINGSWQDHYLYSLVEGDRRGEPA
jgi:ribosomal-protein-alanine N-acetyltransferase